LIDRTGEMPPLLPPPPQPEQQVGDLLDLVGGMITVGLIAPVYEGGRARVPLQWARVPAEMIADMRQSPLWPTLEATAHTLVYDSRITGSMPPDRLSALSTPTLVLGSEGSTGQLRNRVQGIAEALPNASARFLPDTWHGVSAEHLAPALAESFTGR
jgi:hypothetical protein